MWDCLVAFSTWAENNSGQIQIVIAVAALIYAWKAYHKVLDQIKISNRQEQTANDQRGFELKIQALSLLLTALDKNHASQKNLNGIVENLEKSIEIQKDNNVNKKDVKEAIKSSKAKIEEFQSIQKLIISLCEEINKRESIDQKTIKLLYEALLGATKDAHSFELLNQVFREV